MFLRKVSQVLFLILFLFFFFHTRYSGVDELPLKVAIFLKLDPLISFALFLSERNLSAFFSISLIVLVMTFVLGRVFCGWVCPMGTIHDVTSKVLSRKENKENGWYKWKYYVLITFLVCSVFSLNLVGILDPIALLIRSLAVGVSPLFDFFFAKTADVVYSTSAEFLVKIWDHIYGFSKSYFLSFERQYFLNSGWILVIFLIVLLLNRISNRFFCKNLCPLGALLGLVAQSGFLKREVKETCDSCGKCLGGCKMGMEDEKGWRKSECLVCLRCKDVCPLSSVEFSLSLPKRGDRGIDLERRRVLSSGVYGLLIVGGIRLDPFDDLPLPRKIRPPGSVGEKEFKNRCVKCGECMKVCLTNVLHPAIFETGLDGLWTPIVDFRTAYCEYNCTLCTQVCPSGAIEKLNVSQKKSWIMGLAYIDPARCIPYREANNCIVCEEFCPTSPKAIYFERTIKRTREGEEKAILLPKVDYSRCIGCGVCEYKCPVIGKKAIYVLPPEIRQPI